MQLQAMKYEHGHSGCVPWADWLPRIQCVSISLSNFYPTPLSSQIYKQGDNNQVSFKKATKQNGAEHAVLYGMWLSICFFFMECMLLPSTLRLFKSPCTSRLFQSPCWNFSFIYGCSGIVLMLN